MESATESETVFDPAEWPKKNFSERVSIAAREFILGGLNYPFAIYVFHALKVAGLFAAWVFFCSFTPGMGTWGNLGEWMFEPTAFQKAFLFSMMYEALGFGCMSGPLGLRLVPPFTAFLSYLRPGSTKLPLFEGAPIIGGHKRTILDVGLYAAFIAAGFYALIQPVLSFEVLLPVVILLPLAALGDRMIFLSSRGEHHFAMVVCFVLAGSFMHNTDENWIAAAKWVQMAIWFWAGVSKCTRAFGYVVPLMTANNPLMKSSSFRKRLFKNYPDDLSPSAFGVVMAHGGTLLEFGAPLLLLWVTGDGPLLWVGIGMATILHLFIISNMPVASVFEWNLLSLYSGWFLFYFHPEVSLFAVESIPMAVYLVIGALVVPTLGNIWPDKISFLLAKRYYAGNWAWNAWLFRKGSEEKLNKLKRPSKLLVEQQRKYLPAALATEADALFLAFRCLHLQGRILGKLLPEATDNNPFQEYQYCDGETVSASILGWDFGEGHIGDERLIRAIQEQCGFEEGELRVICVEAQPIFGSSLHWRINDAKTGPMSEGHVELDELAKRMPWDYGEPGTVEGNRSTQYVPGAKAGSAEEAELPDGAEPASA